MTYPEFTLKYFRSNETHQLAKCGHQVYILSLELSGSEEHAVVLAL